MAYAEKVKPTLIDTFKYITDNLNVFLVRWILFGIHSPNGRFPPLSHRPLHWPQSLYKVPANRFSSSLRSSSFRIRRSWQMEFESSCHV